MQEMHIYGVSFDLVGKQPIVLLKTADGNKFLPIWIGHPEAAAILMKLQSQAPPRPMTHDLVTDMLEQLGAQVIRITWAPSCSSMSVTRSWVIGRGGAWLWSFIRIAAASGWPIQIGRNLLPSA